MTENKNELLPCPFCSDGETIIREQNYRIGTRNEILFFEIIHWCPKNPLQSSMSFKAKTKEDVIKLWNTRHTAPDTIVIKRSELPKLINYKSDKSGIINKGAYLRDCAYVLEKALQQKDKQNE